MILRLGRRGQVRGIDFSLSMVIFMLMMSQLLILTGNFIQVNQTYQSNVQRTAFADSIARDIVYSDGTAGGTDWLTSTATTINGAADWEFGLTSSGMVNPFKLGRLSNWTIASMLLDYNTVSNGLNLEGKQFAIKIDTMVNVTITSVQAVGSWATAEINGTVTLNNAAVPDSYVQLFTIDVSGFTVSQDFTTTGVNGTFSHQLAVTGGGGLTNTQLTVIAIASSGTGSSGVDVYKATIGTPSTIGAGEVSVFESTVNSAGYSVRVQSSRVHDGATVTAFYTGSSTGAINFTQTAAVSGTDLETNPIWDADDLAVPNSGMLVIIVHETLGGIIKNENILTFPAVLDDSLSKILQPATQPTSINAVSSITFMTSGVLMRMEVTVWE